MKITLLLLTNIVFSCYQPFPNNTVEEEENSTSAYKKMGAEMDNNQTNETKKSIWVESKWESKIMFIGAWGVFQLLLFI